MSALQFLDLPDEIIQLVMTRLSAGSLGAMDGVSRSVFAHSRNNTLWETLLKRDYQVDFASYPVQAPVRRERGPATSFTPRDLYIELSSVVYKFGSWFMYRVGEQAAFSCATSDFACVLFVDGPGNRLVVDTRGGCCYEAQPDGAWQVVKRESIARISDPDLDYIRVCLAAARDNPRAVLPPVPVQVSRALPQVLRRARVFSDPIRLGGWSVQLALCRVYDTVVRLSNPALKGAFDIVGVSNSWFCYHADPSVQGRVCYAQTDLRKWH
jgi:hypothetical protein